MPTHDLHLPRTCSTLRTSSTWRARSGVHPFAAAVVTIRSWIERTRQRHALSGLDDQMLRDIGITRADAARECDKPFWRG